MSYPKQDSVMRRLQAVNLRALSARSDKMREDAAVLWRQASRLLKADIAAAYQASAQGGKWDLTSFQSSGMYHRLSARAGNVLGDFHKRSVWKMRNSFGALRAEGARRQAWAIDQVTPRSVHVKYHKLNVVREANVPLTSGFEESWGEWVAGYHVALLRNLRMNALSAGSLMDAVAEVDATRVSTPAYTLEAAMDRLWEYESWAAISGGMHQAVEDNPDSVEEEVWRTSGDLRVCDDCDANEGLRLEDADGTVPLHPNCNCFYQVVPTTYAELLRSGDEADQELAADMDAEGVAPNAMVLRGTDGEIKGKAVVDFADWEEANGLAVQGR